MKNIVVIKINGKIVRVLTGQKVYNIYLDAEDGETKGKMKDGREVVKEGDRWVLNLSRQVI